MIRIISGVSYDKKDVCNNGIRILRGGNINNLAVTTFDNDVFLPEKYRDVEKQLMIGDILIVASTGSKAVIGKAGYVNDYLSDTQIGAFLRIIRPIFAFLVNYIKLLFASEYYREHIRLQAQGTNINNVKAEYITEILFPLPPLDEQARIVNEIERFEPLIAEYERLEQQATKLDGEIYDNLKKSILQYAIQGKLVPQDSNDEPANILLEKIRAEKKAKLGKKYVESYIYKGDDNCYYEKVGSTTKNITDEIPFDIPENWEWARLGYIVDFSKSTTVSSNEINGNDWILDLEDIEKETGRLLIKKRMSDIKSKSDKHKFSAGNVLYSKLRPYLNKVIIADENGYCTTEILAFDFGCYVDCRYAQIYLMSPFFVDYAMSGAYGVKMPRIGSDRGNLALIPIPPLEEQKRIATAINKIFSKVKDEV